MIVEIFCEIVSNFLDLTVPNDGLALLGVGEILTNVGVAIIKVRQSHDSLIFIKEITIPGKAVFMLRQGPTDTVKMVFVEP